MSGDGGKRLRDLAAYRYCGGLSFCADCRATPGFSCARFGCEGACPENTHALQSVEGRALAAIGASLAHQRRIGPAGYAGLDMPACLAMTEAQGIPTSVAALLLPFWELGLLQASARNRETEGKS